MCFIVQRYYICRTRKGVPVHTEEEMASKGESHYPGRYLVRCSTPLMIPELNEEVTNDTVHPCYGGWDLKEERYAHPCPDCRGDHPYLQDPAPDVKWHPFIRNIDDSGRGDDPDGDALMRVITDRVVDSLAKTIYCWIDMHWSADLLNPQTVRAPDLGKEIISTCHDMLCLETASHGSRLSVYPSYPKCPCPINEEPDQHNVATAMRQWMNNQTATGHAYFLERAQFAYAQDKFPFDLFDHWKVIPRAVWLRNPFLEFVETNVEPNINNGQWLGRVYNGQDPLFGLESALKCSLMRVERLQTWEADQDPPILVYNEPLTREAVETRRRWLLDRINDYMSRRRRWRGWWLSNLVLVKAADILAHDSGLVDYRITLAIDCFLRAYGRIEPNPPRPAPPGPVRRPPFQPRYVDALFRLIFNNATEFERFPHNDYDLNLVLREHNGNTLPGFPFWVVPESHGARDARIEEYRRTYSSAVDFMKKKAKMIDDHIVKYILDLESDVCTACNRPMGQIRPGSQLCQKCKVRTGYSGDLDTFGDKTFLRKVEEGGAGPMEEWKCNICYKDFNNDDPPFEVPTETIRCHGPRHTVTGSACLRIELLGTGEKMFVRPRCLWDRQALCQWDHNIFENREHENDDDWMDPRAHYKLYGMLLQ